MRRLLFVPALLALLAPAAGADDLTDWLELGLTGGIADGPGYAGKAPTIGTTLAVGTDMFRIRGSASWTQVHKAGTPGGYSVGGGGGFDLIIKNVIFTGGMMYHFTDQDVWLKRVHYASGGIGYRWAGPRHKEGVPLEISDLRLIVYHETYSTYANDVTGVQASYTYDRRLGLKPWCVRLAATVGGMYFNQGPEPGAARRQGATLQLGVGMAYRPH